PGQILPAFLRDRLNLTAEQKKQLEKSQKDVDEKVGKVLTDEQKKQLQQPAGGFGRGGPPQPGQIIPPLVQERLKLTDEQKKQLEELQKAVDGELAKMLTDEQQKQLKEMRSG